MAQLQIAFLNIVDLRIAIADLKDRFHQNPQVTAPSPEIKTLKFVEGGMLLGGSSQLGDLLTNHGY